MKQMPDPVPSESANVGEIGDGARSVAELILQAFIKALASKPDFEAVAARMKTEIIDKEGRSEAALRRALFGDGG
jgi:hypothetical protein